MTGLDPGAVAAALAAAALNVAPVLGKKLRSLSYIDPKPPTPIFMVGERTGVFDGAMARGVDGSGSSGNPYLCRLYAAPGDQPRIGAQMLDAYLSADGPASIRKALSADRTLGGACQTMRVVSWDGYAIYTVGDAGFYGVIIRVEVW